jgi:FAD/FMN-containing dehydrogenase
MIRRNGAGPWRNVHVTETTRLDDLIDIDNSSSSGPQPAGLELLTQAARDLDALVQQARAQGRRIRALGSGWALTDIAITDGWLVNTKRLNGCFDMHARYFDPAYPAAKRPHLVVAQCGISIAELNVHLEVTAPGGVRRALRTAGIGAGQTIAGAISGNTHGAAINFGAMPDFVVGLQLVTGSGRSVWLERASEPVLNEAFAADLDAELIRADDLLDAAIVSFGAFGIITAVALETEPLYQLRFPPVRDIAHDALKRKLDTLRSDDPPGLHHYEFIFDPYSKSQQAMETHAVKVPYEPGHPVPAPVWIVRNDRGFAPGDRVSRRLFSLPLLTAGRKTAAQFAQYRERCILGDVRATPGQLYTATISYFEGFTESAFGVSLRDAARMIDISTDVIRRMKLPAMSQVRLVHPTRALLGFTHLGPKTAVFEFGLVKDAKYRVFEDSMIAALTAANVRYTLHWSKNSGIDPHRLAQMYDASRIDRWRQARSRVFGGDASLMRVFDNAHVTRAGLA